MTYKFVVKSGWFCRCGPKAAQTANDTWDIWQLCASCRLPIKESGAPAHEDKHKRHRI